MSLIISPFFFFSPHSSVFYAFLFPVIFLRNYKPYLSLHFFHGYMKKLCFSHAFHQEPCSGAEFTTTVGCQNKGTTQPDLTINIFSFAHWSTHRPSTATLRHQVNPEWGDSISCHSLISEQGPESDPEAHLLKSCCGQLAFWKGTLTKSKKTQNVSFLIKRKYHQRLAVIEWYADCSYTFWVKQFKEIYWSVSWKFMFM